MRTSHQTAGVKQYVHQSFHSFSKQAVSDHILHAGQHATTGDAKITEVAVEYYGDFLLLTEGRGVH